MRSRSKVTPYLLIAPAVATFAFVVLGPILATVGFSFFEWKGFGPMTFVGADNYVAAIRDGIFRRSFVNVTIYVIATIGLEVAVGLVLAGLVSLRPRGSTWFRIAFFIPVTLPIVVVAVLWSFVYNADFGLLNAFLEGIGLERLTMVWLGDIRTALGAVSVVSGWIYAGFYMAIFYAAFSQLPLDVLEAARLDGASEPQIFRRIKVPMIRQVTEVALLLCVTGGIQAFDLFFVLTNGGPFNATEVPTTHIVTHVFRYANVGYGSAMAIILTAVVLAIGILYTRVRTQSRTDMGAI